MTRFPVIAVVFLSCGAAAFGQHEPRVGYAYPAGGRVGTTFRMVVGGQYIRNISTVEVSGDGVSVKIVKSVRDTTNFKKEQRDILRKRFMELWRKRAAELSPENRVKLKAVEGKYRMYLVERKPRPPKNKKRSDRGNTGGEGKKDGRGKKASSVKDGVGSGKPAGKSGKDAEGAVKGKTGGKKSKTYKTKAPEHSLLVGLEDRGLRGLLHVLSLFVDFQRKLQQNRQLGEAVVLEVAIAPDASPGYRELRLKTKRGEWTNPLAFQVGSYPEAMEFEPNNNQYQMDGLAFLDGVPASVPVVFNGQIFPGDVDRFRFRALKGARLVVRVASRRLVPYLADTVPGWSQPVVSVLDSKGRGLAWRDDYRFDPDPVLFFDVPEDGTYQIEIRDAIYRGRQDFVYRVSVAESPFVTGVFPLGGRVGSAVSAGISGRNLPVDEITLDTSSEGGRIRFSRVSAMDGAVSNTVKYAVDDLPEITEDDSANDALGGEAVSLPVMVNGVIGRSGDLDRFSFDGRRGEKVAIEVMARRLGSPLDSLVKLYGPVGKVVAWNDDHSVKKGFLHKNPEGLLTHHADSYLLATLPADGKYVVQLSDAQRHGGADYAYRLRISPPRPRFDLMVSPSSMSLKPGGGTPISVHLVRWDGFDGEVRLAISGAEGFRLVPSLIPAGVDDMRVVLMVPPQTPRGKDFHPEIAGIARLGGGDVPQSTVAAIPADDVMQAFLYRHLVPAERLFVSTLKGRTFFVAADSFRLTTTRGGEGDASPITLENPLVLRPGESRTVTIEVGAKHALKLKRIRFVLDKPPKGVSSGATRLSKRAISFVVSLDAKAKSTDGIDTLIVSTLSESPARKDERGKMLKKRVWPIGYYFAIPYRIIGEPGHGDEAEKKN